MPANTSNSRGCMTTRYDRIGPLAFRQPYPPGRWPDTMTFPFFRWIGSRGTVTIAPMSCLQRLRDVRAVRELTAFPLLECALRESFDHPNVLANGAGVEFPGFSGHPGAWPCDLPRIALGSLPPDDNDAVFDCRRNRCSRTHQ